MKNTLF